MNPTAWSSRRLLVRRFPFAVWRAGVEPSTRQCVAATLPGCTAPVQNSTSPRAAQRGGGDAAHWLALGVARGPWCRTRRRHFCTVATGRLRSEASWLVETSLSASALAL